MYKLLSELPNTLSGSLFRAAAAQSVDSAPVEVLEDVFRSYIAVYVGYGEQLGVEQAGVEYLTPRVAARKTLDYAADVEPAGKVGLYAAAAKKIAAPAVGMQLLMKLAFGRRSLCYGAGLKHVVVNVFVDKLNPVGQKQQLEQHHVVLVDALPGESLQIVSEQRAAEYGGAHVPCDALSEQSFVYVVAGADIGTYSRLEPCPAVGRNHAQSGQYDVGAVGGEGMETFQCIGRHDVVAVAEDYELAACRLVAAAACQHRPFVAGLVDEAYARVAKAVFPRNGRGAVGGTVVDDEGLEVGECLGCHGVETARQVTCCVVDRYDDAYQRGVVCHCVVGFCLKSTVFGIIFQNRRGGTSAGAASPVGAWGGSVSRVWPSAF